MFMSYNKSNACQFRWPLLPDFLFDAIESYHSHWQAVLNTGYTYTSTYW